MLNGRARPAWPWLGGLTCALALLLLWMNQTAGTVESPPEADAGSQPATAASAGASSPTPRLSAPSMALQASQGHARPSVEPSTSLMHARDAYAAAMQAREGSRPGGYFAAEALLNACREALNASMMAPEGFPAPVVASGPLRADVPAHWQADPPQRQAARLAALQEAQARCGTLWAHRQGLHDPPPQDRAAQALLEASRRVGDAGPGLPFAARREWLLHLHRQRAWLNPDYVLVFSPESFQDAGSFEGQRWGGASSQAVYELALRLAGQAYGFDPAADRRSVASLAVCIRMGACEGSLEEVVLAGLPANAPWRAEVLALYPRMLAALRRGDVDAFAPSRGPDGR